MREHHVRTAEGACLAVGTMLSVFGCGAPSPAPADRYLVTSSAIDVGRGIRLCVAVDPRDAQGVWWWEPGASGCTTRSTGPGVLHPDKPSVAPAAGPGVTEVAFELGLHARTPTSLHVRLRIEDGHMTSLDTDARVALQPRHDLELPWELPPP